MRGGNPSPSTREEEGGGGVWRKKEDEEEEDEEDAGYQVEGEEEEESAEEGRPGGGREKNKESTGSTGRNWVVLVVLFVFQLTLPSILWSYGVLLARMLENNDVKLPVALWTPALFSATLYFAEPWCRWPAIKRLPRKRRAVIAGWMLRPMSSAGIFLTAGSLAVSPILISRNLYMITYGIFAGLGTSMALTQSELLLDQHFPPRRKRRRRRVLIQASMRVGCSLSQLISPMLLFGIMENYGRRYAPLLHSGFVLQALIAASLVRNSTNIGTRRRNVKMRDMRYSIMEDDDGTESGTGWQCGIPGTTEGDILLPFEEDLAGRSWKNPAKDDATAYDLKDDDDIYTDEINETADTETSSTLLQFLRRKNCYGVEILPQIPEETEEEESGEGRQSKRSSRRLTITIPNIDNVNNNNGKEVSVIESILPETPSNLSNGNYHPDTPTSTSSTTFLITQDHGLRKWKRWKWRRKKWRRRRTKSSERELEEGEEEETAAAKKKGCCESFKEIIDVKQFCKASFYPSLALSASFRLANMVFFSLVPYMAKRMGKSNNDAVLVVSLAGFSSLIVAASVPWISFSSPKSKVAGLLAPRSCKKILYCFGSLVSSFSFFLLSRCDWYDRMTLASILFGIGSGAVSDTTGSIVRAAYGCSEIIEGASGLLCTLTAFFILGFTGFISLYVTPEPVEVTSGITSSGIGSLSVCFSVVAITQFMTGITWMIQPILSRFYRRQRHYTDWNPQMFLHAA